MNNTEKRHIISEIRKHELYVNDIPDQYAEDKDVIDAERQAGMRRTDSIGFDVINQNFFVNESILEEKYDHSSETWYSSEKRFNSFGKYYCYLDGNIYENACYYQWDFKGAKKKDLDINRVCKKKSLIDYNIDNYTFLPSIEEEDEYDEREKVKILVKKWSEKFISCDTYEKLLKMTESYDKSVLYTRYNIKVDFFFWQYVNKDRNDKHRFDIIMEYMTDGRYPAYKMLNSLCHVYDPNEVLMSYGSSLKTKGSTFYRNRNKLKCYIDSIGEAQTETPKVFFDASTHYYCEQDSNGVRQYFYSFEDLIKYRNYDLTNTDLTRDIRLNRDMSDYKMDDTTKLPTTCTKGLTQEVSKRYSNGSFEVIQAWYDTNGTLLKKIYHEFDYFFDFVYFLKGDLSGADLLSCDGLINLRETTDLDFSDAKMTSSVCDRLGIMYSKYLVDSESVISFSLTEENENNTLPALHSSRDVAPLDEFFFNNSKEIVLYISDLHMMHKLKHLGVKSNSDIDYIIRSTVDNIINDYLELYGGNVILIGGDVSSDYSIFEKFIISLKERLSDMSANPNVIFVLGNHELWSFPSNTIMEIEDKYEELITKCGMMLLRNNILYMNNEKEWRQITEEDIIKLNKKDIRKQLASSRITIFGGLAFSGQNEEFNADNGIYRGTVSRGEEIEESKRFERLYDKVLSSVPDMRIIVLTHTPIDCWCSKPEYNNGYIYVSGHTHRNFFYDDGETRIYADNQIGYINRTPHLKWFEVDNEYDIFCDYCDGIYDITPEEYVSFFRGKNIEITFNRKPVILHMLKKNGYYCFITESRNRSLCILNGGAMKRLDKRDIHYYFDNMETVISTIKDPLDKYSTIQKKISDEIKKLGGTGTIHGCIIDINWYCHIYVNPLDSKLTSYWARDITQKIVYPNVMSLLENECPSLYAKYLGLTEKGNREIPLLSGGDNTDVSLLPQIVLETDIYRASREIRKMQKLSTNILTIWYDANKSQKLISSKRANCDK